LNFVESYHTGGRAGAGGPKIWAVILPVIGLAYLLVSVLATNYYHTLSLDIIYGWPVFEGLGPLKAKVEILRYQLFSRILGC